MHEAYFRARWRGEVPLATVFWNDMLFVGTTVNIMTTFVAMGLLTLGVPTMPIVLTYFAPLPFNLFLVAAVWRSAENAAATTGFAARCASLVWLVAATAL